MANKSRTAQRTDLADRLWKEGSKHHLEGDIKAAVKLYRRAARLGNDSAQNNLGTLLDDHVSPQKPKEAIYWFKRAVRQGNYYAARNLALHYRDIGKPRWQIHWLRVATQMGYDEAKAELRALTAKRRTK